MTRAQAVICLVPCCCPPRALRLLAKLSHPAPSPPGSCLTAGRLGPRPAAGHAPEPASNATLPGRHTSGRASRWTGCSGGWASYLSAWTGCSRYCAWAYPQLAFRCDPLLRRCRTGVRRCLSSGENASASPAETYAVSGPVGVSCGHKSLRCALAAFRTATGSCLCEII